MTHKEIEDVIRRDGYLIWFEEDSIIVFKPIAVSDFRVQGVNACYKHKISGSLISSYAEGRWDDWTCEADYWREATPEEIKQYVK